MPPSKLPCGHLVMEADSLYRATGRDLFMCGDCGSIYEKTRFGYELRNDNQLGAPSGPVDPDEAKRERDRLQDERLRTQMIEGLRRLKDLADSD